VEVVDHDFGFEGAEAEVGFVFGANGEGAFALGGGDINAEFLQAGGNFGDGVVDRDIDAAFVSLEANGDVGQSAGDSLDRIRGLVNYVPSRLGNRCHCGIVTVEPDRERSANLKRNAWDDDRMKQSQKDILATFVREDALEEALEQLSVVPDAEALLNGELQLERLSLIVVLIKHGTVKEIAESTRTICEILSSNRFYIYGLNPPLLIASADGPGGRSKDPDQACVVVADAIIGSLAKRVKVLHGSMSGALGCCGSRDRLAFSPIFPRLGSVLEQLAAVEFGTVQLIR
jgi:hypothetical protein